MKRTAWQYGLAVVAAVLIFAAGERRAEAQYVYQSCYAPAVSYYPAPVAYTPAVSYYYTPRVSYYAAPAVSYYAAPAVSYYPSVSYYPAVSYYPSVSYYGAPASGAVTTTHYGLFGRPKSSTTYYYTPVYVP